MNEISYSKFIDGLNKAGVTINRKMLSEIAIQDSEAFTKLVVVAKDALAGKAGKPASKEEKVVAVKEEAEDLSKKTVAELKEMAKAAGVEGYTTMKKADLLEALK